MRFAITFVCQSGELEAKAALLAASLRRFIAGPVDLVACTPSGDEPAPATRRLLDSLGVRRVTIRNPVSPDYPIGNKVACLGAAEADRVVFLDSDILCIAPLDLERHFAPDFTAKPADFNTFSSEPDLWRRLYGRCGLPEPVRRVRATISGEEMWPYFNAGVIAVRGDAGLAAAWARICREIDADPTIPMRRPHLDQIALPLAAASCGLEFTELPEALNFPAHVRRLRGRDAVLYHYHWPAGVAGNPALVDLLASLVHEHPDLHDVLAATDGWSTWAISAPAPRHDISRADLDWALDRSPDADTLRDLVAVSRERFGWFSRQVSRAFEYPWVAAALEETSPLPVLDIGTGVSPLPVYLARRGRPVVTVDNSPVIRRPNMGPRDWDGWGFLDYTALHPGIRSLNVDAVAADIAPGSLAAAYSVSVLEHIPARARRALWPQVARWLAPGGRLLLTLDLEPGSDLLWNRVQGRQVEDPAEHGSIDSIVAELVGLGFTPVRRETLRDLPGMEADCALLDFRGPGMAASVRRAAHSWRWPWNRTVRNPAMLVGCMRSGTTLLADLLGRAPGVVHCPFELKHVWSGIGGVPMASPRTRDAICPQLGAADVRPGQAAALAAAFAAEVRRHGGRRGDVFLTKNPHLCNKLPFVHALFPEARFLFIRRRLPAVVASLVALYEDVLRRQRAWHVWPESGGRDAVRCWEVFHHVAPPETIDSRRRFPGGDIRCLAEYWLESNLAIARFVGGLPDGVALAVETERLLADPGRELARCLDHLGVRRGDLSAMCGLVDPARGAVRRDRLSAGELDGLREFVRERRRDFEAVAPGETDATLAAIDALDGPRS
jgi:hypothetical protein